MPHFMLLLHENPNAYSNFTPEQMEKLIEKYQQWSARVAGENKLLGGHKLADEGGKRMQKGARLEVKDGAFGEAKEVIGGYYLIAADSYEDAVRLCHEHPHLLPGNTIEIRRVDPMVHPESA
ncbi:MAG: transcription initiation protein [Planctomycetes bacterium]|nr:transcription initiation protein [Planctomycetota bacterium]